MTYEYKAVCGACDGFLFGGGVSTKVLVEPADMLKEDGDGDISLQLF